ncbi:alpha-amylase family glycosyl hydrolase [Aquabacterium humicola]|uniref:alpha-amylase family glycosyl hydrolase n=1 Tax=Aquabacterium humicola TaxID=3237377 RepID=UPI0025429285|nr:alpha-amylase family glycosyl hydrolase [Rubrivivax pictus]
MHLAYTNHKYDALDYRQVSPEFGTRADVKALAANLPELNLEHAKVREHVYGGRDSVVRSYLRDGIDGWRLDVAVDIGFRFLDELTRAAHAQKPGSPVVGEIANYPKEWFPSVDAVMNFPLRELLLRTVSGRIEPQTAQRMIARLVNDAGIEPMLKSWLMLDNHDTARLATSLPDERQRRLAQLLQFTLPGAPNLYYGSEVGMTGGDDPEMRAPMRWDLVRDDDPTLQWTRRLVELRKRHRALRIGDFRTIESTRLLAFERHTDRARDTVLVFANPGSTEVSETVMVANSKLMNTMKMLDVLGAVPPQPMNASLLQITLPPHGFLVLAPEVAPPGGYSAYKRVQ